MGSGSSEDYDSEGYDDESIEDIEREVDKALMSGVCPQCGCGLAPFDDEDGSGLRCCVCGWECFVPDSR